MRIRLSPLFPPQILTLLILLTLLLLLPQPASATAVPADNTNPFAPPICRDGYLSCDTVEHPEVCCPVNYVCTFDGLGTIACCPYQSACTGHVIPQNLTKYQIPAPASDSSGAGGAGVVRGGGGGEWRRWRRGWWDGCCEKVWEDAAVVVVEGWGVMGYG